MRIPLSHNHLSTLGVYSPGNPHVIIDNLSISYETVSTSYDTVCNYSKNGYRYGFNGKRIDEGEEGMGGGGSTYDYGFRIYNPSLGRFLSVDPMEKYYSFYSTYQFSGNSSIAAIDIEGLEEFVVITWWCQEDKSYHTKIKLINKDGPLIVNYYIRVFHDPNLTFNQQVVATTGFKDISNGARKGSDYNTDEQDKVWNSNEQKTQANTLLNEVNDDKKYVGINFKEASGYKIIKHTYEWKFSCTNYNSVKSLLDDPHRTIYICKAIDITKESLMLEIEEKTEEEKKSIEEKMKGYNNVELNVKVNPELKAGAAVIKSYRRIVTQWEVTYKVKKVKTKDKDGKTIYVYNITKYRKKVTKS